MFTVQLSGTTNIIVTRLSDTDLSDVGSPTTFDISPSSRYSLGPYGVASGDYGVIDNIVLRQSGGAVVDVWDRGSITAIGPGIPGEPGSFFLSNASFRTGNSRVSFSGRTETSLGALPDAEGSGDVFDIDQATSGKLWTFTVGPGSS